MTKLQSFWAALTKPQRAGLFIGICLVTALAVVLLTAYIVQASYMGKIMPRTTVAGLDLGGQNADQAARTLADQAHWLSVTKISLALNNTKQTVSAIDLGISIDPDTSENSILTPDDPLGWLKINFWRDFFRSKTVPLTFSRTDEELQKTLSEKFGLTATPKDATLAVTNGQLTVVADQPGETISIPQLKTALSHLFLTGDTAAIALQLQNRTPATIGAAAVAAVKDQINASLHPVTLTGNGKTFVISVADQYSLIDYATENSAFHWQISETKLTDYLKTTVAKKLNIKPVQQVIENNTGRVITAGVNGSTIDVFAAQPSVLQAITSANPKPATIAVPFKDVAFSETHVNPSYSLNLFQGLYLDVSLSTQQLTVINTDTVINQYRISSGGWKTPTPTGTLYIFNKIRLAYSPDFKLWMPNWNGLATSPDGTGYLGYGLHAIVCWDKACTNREGANHIGTPVSHGCIRVDDAGIAYIYDNAPVGTPVVIHQ